MNRETSSIANHNPARLRASQARDQVYEKTSEREWARTGATIGPTPNGDTRKRLNCRSADKPISNGRTARARRDRSVHRFLAN